VPSYQACALLKSTRIWYTPGHASRKPVATAAGSARHISAIELSVIYKFNKRFTSVTTFFTRAFCKDRSPNYIPKFCQMSTHVKNYPTLQQCACKRCSFQNGINRDAPCEHINELRKTRFSTTVWACLKVVYETQRIPILLKLMSTFNWSLTGPESGDFHGKHEWTYWLRIQFFCSKWKCFWLYNCACLF
jgi:hypothetical protein